MGDEGTSEEEEEPDETVLTESCVHNGDDMCCNGFEIKINP